jgi:hypothetical protein
VSIQWNILKNKKEYLFIHHVSKHLHILAVFQVWKYPCAQVIFDSDPAPTGRSVPAQIEEMSQAMIRYISV